MTRLRAALCLLLTVLSACASGTAHRREGGIDALRRAAAEQPRDAKLQGQLALAELFAYDGDPARAERQLEHALLLTPRNPRLWLAFGLRHDSQGRPKQALEAYLRALPLAIESTDPVAPQIAELAVHAIDGVDGGSVGYSELVRSTLLPLLDAERLSSPARYELGTLLIKLARRRGDLAEAQRIVASLGCATELRAAGPFGPRDLLGFDRDHGVVTHQEMADSYDLGTGRGVRKTRPLGARGCGVHAGGGPLALGGTTYVQTMLEARTSGMYLVRFESPNSAELYVDGKRIARLDRRLRPEADVQYLHVSLTAGTHLFHVKLTTRHPNPVLALALSRARTADASAVELPYTDSDLGFARYLRAATALGRGDAVSARLALAGVERSRHAAPLLLLQRASVMFGDPLMPSELAEDEGRRLLEAALERDPGLWNASAQLARMAASNGRSKEAIAALRAATQRWPEVPALRLTLASMLQDEGWDAEADRAIAAARRLVPDACAPLAAELESLRDRQREQAAEKLVEPLMACETQSNARYALHLRKRDFAAARLELERLASFEPPQHEYAWSIARLELAKSQGDTTLVTDLIAKLRETFPGSSTAVIEQVDRLAAEGSTERALAALQAAVAAEPATLAELLRLSPVLGGAQVLERHRRNGREAIVRFEASGRSYEAPEVLVFDYMAAQIFPDGSSIELVHTIERVQSEESLDDLAEVDVPEGARVLTLRTLKPDGRALEPDAIAGKDTVSLPNVAIGDYIEKEMLLHRDPPEAFPGGHAGERFYFKSFEVPFDHSEMVLVLPEAMPYAIDPRGPAPKAEISVENGQRIVRFAVDESRALVPEPGAVSAREYLPSVRLGVNATWPLFVESLRDAMIDRDLHDPELAQQAREIAGKDALAKGPRAIAEKLYAWVLENVENDQDVFSQAAVMLRSRSGNRARVLCYLLRLLDVDAKLALVRSVANDATVSEMADGDTYEHLLVTFDDTSGPLWLFTVERWAPFGFVPPLLAGQPALLLAEGFTETTVPARDLELDRRDVLLTVQLRANGSAHIDVEETLRGADAVSFRSQLESVPDAELEQRFESEYAGRFAPGASLAGLAIEDRKDPSKPLKLKFGLEVSMLGRQVEGGIALPPLLPSQLAASLARVPLRTTTQLVASPTRSEWTMRVKLPANAKTSALPKPVTIESTLAGRDQRRPRFTLRAARQADGIELRRSLTLPILRVAPESYAAFSELCRSIDQAEAQELIVLLP